ncbi:hypothetical protein [Polaromonas sp. CG9_12]|nr:hypothetical protein [Polaromonas sp. CG9_12]
MYSRPVKSRIPCRQAAKLNGLGIKKPAAVTAGFLATPEGVEEAS